MFHNELHCRMSFSHPFFWSCCLLLSLLYELDLSFSHLLVSIFCAYKLLYPYTTLYCRLQCTVVLVGVVLKGSLGGTTF